MKTSTQQFLNAFDVTIVSIKHNFIPMLPMLFHYVIKVDIFFFGLKIVKTLMKYEAFFNIMIKP